MEISRSKFLCVFLLFIYIYNPPVFPRYSSIMWILLFVFIVMKNRMHIWKTYLKIFLATCFFVIWSVTVDVVKNGMSISILRVHTSEIYMPIYILVGVLAIVGVIEKNRYTRKEIWKLIIYTGLFQSLLSLLAYIIPLLQSFLCLFIQNVMSVEEVNWWRQWRLYGISASMMYAMPITQALIGGLCCLYAQKFNSKFYFAVPFIWLSGIINARVAIVVIVLELIAWMLFYRSIKIKREIMKIKKAKLLAESVFFVLVLFGIIGIINDWFSMPRITDPLKEMISILKGDFYPESQGYFAYFYANENSLKLPQEDELLFGAGVSFNKSDVGYIRNIWAGGGIYSSSLYIYYIWVLQRWKKMNSDNDHKLIVLTMALTLFTVNIKGSAFLDMADFLNLFYLGMGITYFYSEGHCRRII